MKIADSLALAEFHLRAARYGRCDAYPLPTRVARDLREYCESQYALVVAAAAAAAGDDAGEHAQKAHEAAVRIEANVRNTYRRHRCC